MYCLGIFCLFSNYFKGSIDSNYFYDFSYNDNSIICLRFFTVPLGLSGFGSGINIALSIVLLVYSLFLRFDLAFQVCAQRLWFFRRSFFISSQPGLLLLLFLFI